MEFGPSVLGDSVSPTRDNLFHLVARRLVIVYAPRFGYLPLKMSMNMNKSEPAPETAAVPPAPESERRPVAGTPSTEQEELPMPVAAAPLTEAEIADLKNLAEQAQQYRDQLLRTAADLDNYRKRAVRERQEAIKFASEGLLQKLVPILDSFDMAMSAANAGENSSAQALQAGVAMIHQQLKTALAESGLEEIDATHQAFDPNFHEAVAQEESTEVPEGHVTRQIRKGYRLRERLLRPASVVVAKSPHPTHV